MLFFFFLIIHVSLFREQTRIFWNSVTSSCSQGNKQSSVLLDIVIVESSGKFPPLCYNLANLWFLVRYFFLLTQCHPLIYTIYRFFAFLFFLLEMFDRSNGNHYRYIYILIIYFLSMYNSNNPRLNWHIIIVIMIIRLSIKNSTAVHRPVDLCSPALLFLSEEFPFFFAYQFFHDWLYFFFCVNSSSIFSSSLLPWRLEDHNFPDDSSCSPGCSHFLFQCIILE